MTVGWVMLTAGMRFSLLNLPKPKQTQVSRTKAAQLISESTQHIQV